MNDRLDRRQFVTAAAGLAAGFNACATASAKNVGQAERSKVPPSERLTTALIGCGGMGRADLRDFLRVPEVRIAAVCDVDTRRWNDALNDITKADHPTDKITKHQDFRQVLDRNDVDAVIIATPDHWHAIQLILTCQAGKDVYCEKPLAHNIVEGRAMVNAVRKYKRVVQMGTQQRSGKHFQDAVRFVQSGKLGKIHAVRTWISEPNNSPDGNGNPPDEPAPKEVDYDMWLGPAPKRPFNPVRFHFHFRWFWDYGNGLCNDWGVHLQDVVLWAMNVDAPTGVCASGGKLVLTDISDTPDTLEAIFDYPGFTHTYSVRRCCDNAGLRKSRHGIEFHGSNGLLWVNREGCQVLADKKDGKDRVTGEKHGTSDQHWPHVQNFVECVKTRQKCRSDVACVHRATIACHLANISYKVGRKVFWDAEAERCRNWDPKSRRPAGDDKDANVHLFREPRKPWGIPTV